MFIVSNPCEIADELASTGQWKHVHWPVYMFPLACGNMSTGQWTITVQRLSGQTHQNYSDKNCNSSNCKALIINALDLLMLDKFRIFIV